MTEPTNGTRYRLDDLQRRLEKIEELRPDVMSDRLQGIADEVKSLRRAFYTFAFGVVGSAVVFAFSVFALLGKG